MNNLIRLLKNNRYAFGMWPDPECYGEELGKKMQAKARQIGQNRFWKYLMSEDGEQCGFMDAKRNFDEYKSLVFRLRLDYEEEPEIVECEIYANHYLVYDGKNKIHTQLSISKVCDNPDFIGFLFADGTVMGSPVKYSVPGITSHGYWASYEDLKTKQALEHHATSVLFRRKKQE